MRRSKFWRRCLGGAVLSLCVALMPMMLAAQPTHVRFAHLGLEQGLSASGVTAILQDRLGFMWLGTDGGLNRYDGYAVTVFQHDPDDPASLSDDYITALFEDHTGVLWIGTEHGLNRYDAERDRFVRYLPQPDKPHSLSDANITTIYEDRDGNLWIGTKAGGVNQFDRVTEQFQVYQPEAQHPNSLSDRQVSKILQDQTGQIWIGTDNGGVNVLDPRTGKIVQYRHDPANPASLGHDTILDIYEDRAGVVWVGTYGGGLNEFDRATGQFTRYLYDAANPASLSCPKDRARDILEDRAGRLWVATSYGGVAWLDRATGQFTRYAMAPGEGSFQVFEDQVGDIWSAGFYGLYRHRSDADTFLAYHHHPADPSSLTSDEVNLIYEDRAGGLWFGTSNGVNIYQRVTSQFTHYQHDPTRAASLSQNDVRSFCEDRRGAIWLATWNGLNKWDRAADTFTHYFHDPANPASLSENDLYVVYADRAGTLWIGTANEGLNQWLPETQTFAHYQSDETDPATLSHNTIIALAEDQTGVLWVGTLEGLNMLDRMTGQAQRFYHDPADPASLSDDIITAMYEDHTGRFWIGTANGLNWFDHTTAQFRHYRHADDDPHSLSDNYINVIQEDGDGVLWLGTEGGLNKFDRRTETFTAYRRKDGLPSDMIYGIQPDRQGQLWLSTNRGLVKFQPQTATFQVYDARDGLQSNQFHAGAAGVTRQGELLFGGNNGFNIFDPAAIKNNPTIPPVVLTDLQRFHTSVKPSAAPRALLTRALMFTPAITLSYRDYVVSFAFAALSYANAEKNRYAYRLEGFEDAWHETTAARRDVTYMNLPAGHYTLRVKASNNDGVWNEQGAALGILVTPPPWKTWWAYTLYALAGAGVGWGYLQYKQRQYKRERKILDRFVPYEYLQFLQKKSILDVQLGDHISRDMGVMFSDIRSFTSLSETMTPAENFAFVNAYLRRVAPVIREQHGFIVKFLGDGVMAVFPHGADSAVKAALAKLLKVAEYNQHRLADGWRPIRIGIGIHLGHIMVGMVGEQVRMEADVISDNVNLTSRLEGLTKYYGVTLIVSGETVQALRDPNEYHIRFLDHVTVKGKEKPITIYEVFDADPADLKQQKIAAQPAFEEGQRLYFDKQFAEAVRYFQQAQALLPDDLATEIYLERAAEFLAQGAPPDWHGVQKMEQK